MDAIHYKVREEGCYISKAIYTLLGLTVAGEKEILGIYLSDNESASYWLSVLTELQNRGLEDILIACIDGLSGFPEPIRKIIYTTNAVEAIHRQFRKLTKTKGAFPNENSLLKLLYAGILNATTKWTMPIQNWSQALSQLDIYFEGRLDSVLDL